jgi:hypothetical protein
MFSAVLEGLLDLRHELPPLSLVDVLEGSRDDIVSRRLEQRVQRLAVGRDAEIVKGFQKERDMLQDHDRIRGLPCATDVLPSDFLLETGLQERDGLGPGLPAEVANGEGTVQTTLGGERLHPDIIGGWTDRHQGADFLA